MEAHKDIRLLPENTRLSYLILRITDTCDVNLIHNKCRVSKARLESKIKRLDSTQAACSYGMGRRLLGKPQLQRRKFRRIY